MSRTLALTVIPAAALVALLAAPALVPAAAGKVQASQPAEIPVTLTVVNQTDNHVRIYWIDHEGRRRFYKALGPQESYEQPTYSSHRWLAVFVGTGVVRRYIARTTDSTWTLR